MKRRFQQISLAWIFRVEELEQLDDEPLVDVFLSNGRLEVGRLEETEEELVDELKVGPGGFKGRLVFFGIEFGAVRARCGRKGAEGIHS